MAPHSPKEAPEIKRGNPPATPLILRCKIPNNQNCIKLLFTQRLKKLRFKKIACSSSSPTSNHTYNAEQRGRASRHVNPLTPNSKFKVGEHQLFTLDFQLQHLMFNTGRRTSTKTCQVDAAERGQGSSLHYHILPFHAWT